MAKKIEETYKVLDQISHVLLRPGTYVGSNVPNTSQKWILSEDLKKMEQKEITYIPSFLKIFDEIITNSIDESKRNKKLDKIEVIVDLKENKITVKDNGVIPCVIHKELKKYVCEVIFGELMSGSNYDDTEQRDVAGLNGLGSKLTNIFSKEFSVRSADGKNEFFQVFKNNMKERSKPIVKKSTKRFTEISFSPDLKQFGLENIDLDHFKMIQKRVYDLAGTNHNIKMYFNGDLINFKSFQDYISTYSTDFYFEESKDKRWSIGISNSENGFQQVSFANSTETYDGGTHIDYILNQIITRLREFFLKKHKVDIKPSDIKSHIFLFANVIVINPSFSSQTKEKLITEPKFFGSEYKVSEKMIAWIMKSEILNSILDWIERKKEADENKLTRQLNKNISNAKVDKLIDAKGKERWKCSLMLFEGLSASSAFRKYRDSQLQGAFSLRGKFTNATDLTIKKLMANEEVVNMMSSIGLKIGEKANLKNLRYGRIIIMTDADYDGDSISGLLLNFFYQFWPELFENRIIYKSLTPIVVATNTKNKKQKISFYTQKEYSDWENKTNLKDWDIKYKKGLAALVDDEYEQIIKDPKLIAIKSSDFCAEKLEIWFGKNTEGRKKEIIENE